MVRGDRRRTSIFSGIVGGSRLSHGTRLSVSGALHAHQYNSQQRRLTRASHASNLSFGGAILKGAEREHGQSSTNFRNSIMQPSFKNERSFKRVASAQSNQSSYKNGRRTTDTSESTSYKEGTRRSTKSRHSVQASGVFKDLAQSIGVSEKQLFEGGKRRRTTASICLPFSSPVINS